MIGSAIYDTSYYYHSFDEFTKWIREYDWDIDRSTMYMLEYDPDEMFVDIWFDWELYITNRESGEELARLIRDGKYNSDKARLFPLDVQQFKRMYFNS